MSYIVSMVLSCTHSQDRDDKLSRHQPGQKPVGAATRGTATAGPMLTVSKAAARGATAATNGGLPGDILVREIKCIVAILKCIYIQLYSWCVVHVRWLRFGHKLSECNLSLNMFSGSL